MDRRALPRAAGDSGSCAAVWQRAAARDPSALRMGQPRARPLSRVGRRRGESPRKACAMSMPGATCTAARPCWSACSHSLASWQSSAHRAPGRWSRGSDGPWLSSWSACGKVPSLARAAANASMANDAPARPRCSAPIAACHRRRPQPPRWRRTSPNGRGGIRRPEGVNGARGRARSSPGWPACRSPRRRRDAGRRAGRP